MEGVNRAALIGLAVILGVALIRRASKQRRSVFSHLRGPPPEGTWGWITGNSKGLFTGHPEISRQWIEEFGPTFRVTSFLGIQAVYTIDTTLISHILSNSMSYYKTAEARRVLVRSIGNGLVVAEGEEHKRQRRHINPAFSLSQIREFTPIFLQQSAELVQHWTSQAMVEEGVANVNVISGLGKTTLNIIGITGFNHNFDALNPDVQDPVSKTFSESLIGITPGTILRLLLPFEIYRDERTKKADEAFAAMDKISAQLLQQRRTELLSIGSVEKKDVEGRDLLSLLIKANLAADVPESQRMTDKEVLAQVPNFLAAGHETTNTATAWALFALARHPSIQAALRAELLAVPTAMPSMDVLNALPLLDRVVRETLRLHPPIINVSRVACADDVLPLATPIVDRVGRTLTELPIAAGTRIFVPIGAIQTSRAVWGEDALEFKPDRWLQDTPEAAARFPGIWSNLMTFISGPHACIGYRFAIVEMKALLFTLLRAFEFELAVPADEVVPVGIFISRPGLRADRAAGPRLPMRLRPLKQA
ncbi:cytochrome P450 [Epithele typhae]|uniref:cytochrome P450 n=1 Tax=Epithele typhae TaxID=378194 RepID=UPI0020080649|nr:cytochrome P450 [Epithele typhae]KAH9940395.1 cytochrome P450 [Epithele typhae]